MWWSHRSTRRSAARPTAFARPQTTVGGDDADATIWLKAAARLQPIVGDQALVDGNKRLGWPSVAVFLEINDVSVAAAFNDDVLALVMEAAPGRTSA